MAMQSQATYNFHLATSINTYLHSRARGFLSLFFIVFVPHLLVSCSSNSPTSQRGIQICKNNQTAIDPGFSAQQRHLLYRQCLAKIDSEIRRNSEAQRKAKLNVQEAGQSTVSDSPRVSASEIFTFCSFNSPRISDLYRTYSYKTGQLARATYLDSQDRSEINQLTAAISSVHQELEALVKPQYRIGMPLLPDAAKLLMRCNQQEIIAAVGGES
jgi:hypothetical protein